MSLSTTPRACFELLRWLGPWADDDAVPSGVSCSEFVIEGEGDDRDLDVLVYRPTDAEPTGAWVITPGFHFNGPADPRFVRLASVFARAGNLVFCPTIPDLQRQIFDPRMITDFERAYAACCRHPAIRQGFAPAVFSISFGSLPTLRLAAHPVWRDRLPGAVVFGGYIDWETSLRFCLSGGNPDAVGEADVHYDPLNQPAVMMSIVHEIEGAPKNTTRIVDAWQEFMRRTWNKPEMKERERYVAVANELALTLPKSQRTLYLQGCGAVDGSEALVDAALKRVRREFEFLNPRPYLKDVRCPIHIIHGAEDDVIPHTEAIKMKSALPPAAAAKTYITGLYAHTNTADEKRFDIGTVPAMAGEGATMLKMMYVLATLGDY